jgi:DegV family protein with EDD domain
LIAIVTDSTVYLTKKEASVYGVRIVPQTYIINGKAYKETYVDSFGNFSSHINEPDTIADTKQPAAEDFLAAFTHLSKKGYEIICITISSRLSGAYYNAVQAKKQLNGGRVEIIDSGLAAGGMYLLVKRARHLAFSGMSLEEVVGGVYKYISSISIRFLVDDLTLLRSSHRLGSVRKSVSTVLNRKPLMRLSGGTIVAEDIAFGSGDSIRKMFSGIPHNTVNLIIHYILPSQRVDAIVRLARRMFPNTLVEHRQLGPVLGIHLGCSVIGVVWSLR